MPKTIAITPVVIHYTVTPESVLARVRTYAGEIAIREETIELAHDDLAATASKSGRLDFAPADVAALVPDAVWGGDVSVSALRADIVEGPA